MQSTLWADSLCYLVRGTAHATRILLSFCPWQQRTAHQAEQRLRFNLVLWMAEQRLRFSLVQCTAQHARRHLRVYFFLAGSLGPPFTTKHADAAVAALAAAAAA